MVALMDAPTTLLVRRFLDSEVSESTAHVMAVVREGEARLTLADADKVVTLDFVLDTRDGRDHALEKALLLQQVVSAFVLTLTDEIERIDDRVSGLTR